MSVGTTSDAAAEMSGCLESRAASRVLAQMAIAPALSRVALRSGAMRGLSSITGINHFRYVGASLETPGRCAAPLAKFGI